MNNYVQAKHDTSLFWHDMWVQCDRPHNGEIANVMRRTRAMYHYAVKNVIKEQNRIKSNRMANAISESNDRNLWKEVHKLRKTCRSVPVDQASVVGPGKGGGGGGGGGAVLVHVGMNDVDKKGSEEVMGRYRELVRELKRVRVGQIVLSGILPVRGGYTRNNRRISINLRLQALCQVEGVGFLNMWEHFEQGDGLFSRDGLHLNKRGAAVLGKGFLRVGDGIGQLSLN